MLAACGGGSSDSSTTQPDNPGGNTGNNGGGSSTEPVSRTLTLQIQGLPEGITLPVTYGSANANLTSSSASLAIENANNTQITLGNLKPTTEQPYLVNCAFSEPVAGTLQADGSLQANLTADTSQAVQCNQKIAVVLEQRQVSVLPASAGSGLNVLVANLNGSQAQWLSPPLMVKQSTIRGKLSALMGNQLYISAKDDDINSATGWELRATDGTAAGTRLVKDLFDSQTNGVGSSSTPTNLTTIGNKIYFSATSGPNRGLNVSDGTETGTQTVSFNDTTISTSELIVANGKLFFTQTKELLSIDDTGTVTNLGVSTRKNLTVVGDRVFITNEDGKTFFSDGTLAGTKEFTAATTISSTPIQIGSWLYFSGTAYGATDVSQLHLWKAKTDGSEAQLIKAFNPSGGSNIGNMVELNGTLVFSAWDGTQTGLYASDGTTSGTQLIHTIKGNIDRSKYAVVNDRLIFLDSEDRSNGSGAYLWTSNGTAAGTQRLASTDTTSFITKNTGGTGYTAFQQVGPDRLLFLIHRGDSSSQYADAWITDGTTAGTQKLRDKDGTAIDVLEAGINAL